MKISLSRTNRALHRPRHVRGFTLIEIMIVVAIIGLLASIAIPNILAHLREVRTTSCINNLKTIDGAKILWAVQTRAADTATPSDADLFGKLKGIKEKPQCPGGGTYSLNPVIDDPACSMPEHSLSRKQTADRR